MRNDGSRMTANQRSSCALTMPDVDIEPEYRNTATRARPIATS